MTTRRDPASSRLLQRVGDVSQIASAREVELREGSEAGVRALDVRTMGGIHALVLVDRGLDIGPAWYAGLPLSWQSSTGIVHPAYFNEDLWLRSFHGGLLVTCGLQNVGAPAVDEGVRHGLHGRISNTAARNVTSRVVWEGDRAAVEVTGEVRETDVYGADLVLHRRLRFHAWEGRIDIADEIENRGHERAGLMLLYHFNAGHPVVADDSRLHAPDAEVVGLDEPARERLQDHASYSAPQRGFPALVYEHRLRDAHAERATIGIRNPAAPMVGELGLAVTYDPRQLPRLWQWRMLAAGMYLTGLEPANCGVLGRAAEREAGSLSYLEPGERRRFDLVVAAAIGSDAATLFPASDSV